jgi:hypothetical protein
MLIGDQWIFDGRKHYVGPKLDVDGMLHGAVSGMEADTIAPLPHEYGDDDKERNGL